MHASRTSRELDRNYFSLVSQQDRDGWQYQAYAPNDRATAILFSVSTGQPLVAVSLRSSDSTTVITERGGGLPRGVFSEIGEANFFQGMMDADGKEFSFVVTNLTRCNDDDERKGASVVVYVMHNYSGKERVMNKINTFGPGETVVIESDKNTGRSLVLRGLSANDGSELGVGDDESAPETPGKRALGTYYCVRVMPQTGARELRGAFSGGTAWRSCDVFARRVLLQPDEEPQAVSLSRCRVRGPPRASAMCDKGRYRDRDRDLDRDRDRISDSCRSRSRGCDRDRDRDRSLSPPRRDFSAGDGVRGSARVVAASQAAEVVEGDRVVDVRSTSSSVIPDVEAAGKPCVMGISLWKEMRLEPDMSPGERKLVGEKLIEAWIGQQETSSFELMVEELRALKTYESEECVVCYDCAPDVVIFRCGHQCYCSACSLKCAADTCPLCRARVSARVPVSVL